MAHEIDIYTTPALHAPDGIESNLVNPYSTHRYLVATSAVCLVFSFLAVTARTFTKAYILRKMEVEDYSLIVAQIGFAGFTGVMLAAGHAGQGRHQWDVSIAGAQRVAYLANILEIIYPPTMFAAKFTVLIQIRKIFTAHQKNFVYWSVQTLVALNFLVYFATFIAFIFACWPREKIWIPHVPGRCISTNASILATSAINLISDFTILFIPAYAIMGLQITWKKKVGVSAIFATGAFVCATSTIRLVYSVRLTHTHDVMWAIAPVGIWALVEFATVILVASFPTLPRLLKFCREPSRKLKYSYTSQPSKHPVVSRKEGTLNTLGDDNKQPKMGSYIPIEERRVASAGERRKDEPWPVIGPPHAQRLGIQKTVEIEMVSH